jgi:hypothetical protein
MVFKQISYFWYKLWSNGIGKQIYSLFKSIILFILLSIILKHRKSSVRAAKKRLAEVPEFPLL